MLIEIPIVGGMAAVDQIASVQMRECRKLADLDILPGVLVRLRDGSTFNITMDSECAARGVLKQITDAIVSAQRCAKIKT
jgi:hypothetical protein